jgi:hypothetical protein
VITESDYEKPEERGKVLRIAVIGSVLVHLLIALFYVGTSGLLSKLHLVPQVKPPEEQVVSLSSSLKIQKRPRPKPVPPVEMHQPQPRPQQPAAAAVQSQPVPQRVAQAPAAPPPVPVKQHHELSKEAPSAPPEPPRTIRATPEAQYTNPPSPPPSAPPSATPNNEKRVALAQHPTPTEQNQHPSHSSRMSQQQIAAVERDLSRTIAQARADTNPLIVPHQEDEGSPKHYAIQMRGAMSRMRSAQGMCDPIKDWYSDGFDYYYVACNVQFSDGGYERQPVPWPVRFKPRSDPFNGTLTQSVPLAGPLPGWQLPPGTPISKELLQYARQTGYNL